MLTEKINAYLSLIHYIVYIMKMAPPDLNG